MFRNMGLHVIKFPSGHYGYVGSIPTVLGTQVPASTAAVMGNPALWSYVMEVKHTPGPWKVTSQRGHVFCVAAGPSDIGLVNKLADAHLIAAAPNLLAALRNITECAEAGAGGANMDLWIEQARTAIAKAEG